VICVARPIRLWPNAGTKNAKAGEIPAFVLKNWVPYFSVSTTFLQVWSGLNEVMRDAA
jgi:hypothetical protein